MFWFIKIAIIFLIHICEQNMVAFQSIRGYTFGSVSDYSNKYMVAEAMCQQPTFIWSVETLHCVCDFLFFFFSHDFKRFTTNDFGPCISGTTSDHTMVAVSILQQPSNQYSVGC